MKLAIRESLAEAKAEPEPPAKVEEVEEEEEEEETNALLKKLRELKKDGFKEEELKAAATKYNDSLKGLNELKLEEEEEEVEQETNALLKRLRELKKDGFECQI